MIKPSVVNLSNGVLFTFKEYELRITAQRTRFINDGTVTGELDIETAAPAHEPNIYYGKFNYLSLETRHRLANYLEKQYKEPPWISILEYIARYIVTTVRRGDRMVDISSAKPVPDIQFAVYPFLQVNQPTTLFGDGATGKSYFALLLAITVKLPWFDNPLGLTIADDIPNDVVWLDYETTEDDFHRRLNRIVKGMDLGEVAITYRRCSQVLADEIDELSLLVNAREPGLVVIDSIGAACAGDLHGSEAPTRFFNAIRRFVGAKLLIFHINREKELYGNRFFWNFSRHAWEIKKQQAEGEDIISVGLFHRKANETKHFQPRGFNLMFDNDTTTIERADVADIPELAKGLPLRERLKGFLKHGPMGLEEIASGLEANQDSIKTVLNRNKSLFIRVGDQWGLIDRNTLIDKTLFP